MAVDLPLIDWKSLRALSDGDTAFEVELLQLFIEDTRSHLEKLAEAIAHHDADQIRRLAHHLKGASANVGALGFAAVAASLEAEARQGDLQNSSAGLQAMQQVFGEIERILKER